VLSLSDRISVLRDGRYQGTLVTSETQPSAVIAKMLGRTSERALAERPGVARSAPVVLAARSLRASRGFGPIDLTVRAGEIVGVAGLEGSGVKQLFQLLFGLERASGGQIEYQGAVRPLRSAADAMRAGAALIPASRRDEGLMLDASLKRNATLLLLDRLRSRFGLIDAAAAERAAQQVIDRLGVVASGTERPVSQLSGGNQQKLLLGRWLATEPKLLLLDDPTRGIDVGAKHDIHALCDALARKGVGILLASSELDETLALSDRILVMHRGSIVRTFEREQATKAELISAMSGAFEA
jgi:ribose transport system ATP-binding protein